MVRKQTRAVISLEDQAGAKQLMISGTDEAVEKAKAAVTWSKVLLTNYECDMLLQNQGTFLKELRRKAKVSIHINNSVANIFGSKEAQEKAIQIIKQSSS